MTEIQSEGEILLYNTNESRISHERENYLRITQMTVKLLQRLYGQIGQVIL